MSLVTPLIPFRVTRFCSETCLNWTRLHQIPKQNSQLIIRTARQTRSESELKHSDELCRTSYKRASYTCEDYTKHR